MNTEYGKEINLKTATRPQGQTIVQSPFQDAIGACGDEILQIGKALAELENRLGIVLSPICPEYADNEAGKPQTSKIVEMVDGVTITISGYRRRLDSLLRRLEI